MKKILLIILTVFLMVGCGKKDFKDISSQQILENITKEVDLENSVTEDLENQDIAERYGISPKDIKSGVVYSSKDTNNSDKIIIVEALEEGKIEHIERAFSSEITGLLDSWKENDKEFKKIEKHIFKTKDLHVILIVSEDAEKIEEIFDKSLE